MTSDKTKLLTFSPMESNVVKYARILSPIHISDKEIPSVSSAEHVGVIRSVAGNLPHIQQRLSSHRKALSAILFSGMARRHRANPLASLRANTIFGIPVLYSGLASLILNKHETDIINQHVKETVQNLLKLHQKNSRTFYILYCWLTSRWGPAPPETADTFRGNMLSSWERIEHNCTKYPNKNVWKG